MIILSESMILVSTYLIFSAFDNTVKKWGEPELLQRTYLLETDNYLDLKLLVDIFDILDIYPSKVNDLTTVKASGSSGNTNFIKLIFPENMNCLNQAETSNQINEGRYFTKEEIERGIQVIILGMVEYRSRYSNKKIGDNISYSDSNYKLIGISKNSKFNTIIPFNTLFNKGLENRNIQTVYINLEFTDELSRNEKKK